ncbi:MAG: amidohydrolase, partial [Clostridia bacterium]|nr:amidohydrolase [Clostridia bacterium]
MSYVQDLSRLVENRKEKTLEISDKVWGYAESRFQEFQSAAAESEYMKELGFKVTMGIGGEETAFVAEYGSGKPVIALL